jgi:ketosteroid isomerase-like protein
MPFAVLDVWAEGAIAGVLAVVAADTSWRLWKRLPLMRAFAK